MQSSVSNNFSRGSGGGIAQGAGFDYLSSPITLIESTVSGNVADRGNGGGIRAWGDVIITRSNISENTSGSFAGGVYARGAVSVKDSTINSNSSYRSGGGVYCYGDISLSGSVITGNAVDYGAGGGIIARGNIEVHESYLQGNSATVAGAIASGYGDLTIVDSIVSGNFADRGGGIAAYELVRLVRSTLSGNTASRGPFYIGDGGGIFSFGFLSIVDSVIDGNSADGPGGGVWSSGVAEIVGTTIAHNSANIGGGVWMRDGSIINSTISTNLAVVGAGIYASNTVLRHSTVTLNEASVHGGGIFVEGTDLTLDHTIVAHNRGENPDLTGLIGSVINAEYSLIGNNSGSGLTPAPVGAADANGNLIGGPTIGATIIAQLGPLANNGGPTLSHALLAGSPAINAGDPAAVAGINGVPVHDQRGAPFTRVFGGRIDIGAVETLPSLYLPGDFNADGIVGAADYTLWRNTSGSTSDLRADGNGDGMADALDYALWKSNFGATVGDVTLADGGGAVAAMVKMQGKPPAEPEAAVREPMAMLSGDSAPQPPLGSQLLGRPGVNRRLRHQAPVDVAVRQDRLLEAWAATRGGARVASDAAKVATRVADDRIVAVPDAAKDEFMVRASCGGDAEALDCALAELGLGRHNPRTSRGLTSVL
jgi:hypothetical protein